MFRGLRRRWFYVTHNKGRIPWCWDCRLQRQAHRDGDWYYHDEPTWMIQEAWENAEPVQIVTERPADMVFGTWATGTGETWIYDVAIGESRRVVTPDRRRNEPDSAD